MHQLEHLWKLVVIDFESSLQRAKQAYKAGYQAGESVAQKVARDDDLPRKMIEDLQRKERHNFVKIHELESSRRRLQDDINRLRAVVQDRDEKLSIYDNLKSGEDVSELKALVKALNSSLDQMDRNNK